MKLQACSKIVSLVVLGFSLTSGVAYYALQDLEKSLVEQTQNKLNNQLNGFGHESALYAKRVNDEYYDLVNTSLTQILALDSKHYKLDPLLSFYQSNLRQDSVYSSGEELQVALDSLSYFEIPYVSYDHNTKELQVHNFSSEKQRDSILKIHDKDDNELADLISQKPYLDQSFGIMYYGSGTFLCLKIYDRHTDKSYFVLSSYLNVLENIKLDVKNIFSDLTPLMHKILGDRAVMIVRRNQEIFKTDNFSLKLDLERTDFKDLRGIRLVDINGQDINDLYRLDKQEASHASLLSVSYLKSINSYMLMQIPYTFENQQNKEALLFKSAVIGASVIFIILIGLMTLRLRRNINQQQQSLNSFANSLSGLDYKNYMALYEKAKTEARKRIAEYQHERNEQSRAEVEASIKEAEHKVRTEYSKLAQERTAQVSSEAKSSETKTSENNLAESSQTPVVSNSTESSQEQDSASKENVASQVTQSDATSNESSSTSQDSSSETSALKEQATDTKASKEGASESQNSTTKSANVHVSGKSKRKERRNKRKNRQHNNQTNQNTTSQTTAVEAAPPAGEDPDFSKLNLEKVTIAEAMAMHAAATGEPLELPDENKDQNKAPKATDTGESPEQTDEQATTANTHHEQTLYADKLNESTDQTTPKSEQVCAVENQEELEAKVAEAVEKAKAEALAKFAATEDPAMNEQDLIVDYMLHDLLKRLPKLDPQDTETESKALHAFFKILDGINNEYATQKKQAIEHAKEELKQRIPMYRKEGFCTATRQLVVNTQPDADSMPKSNFVDFAAFTVPALDVSGNFHTINRIDDDNLVFVIGDCDASGVDVAYTVAVVTSYLQEALQQALPPCEILSYINQRLCKMKHIVPVSLFVGIISEKTGNMIAANAGHCVPILIDDQGPHFVDQTASGKLGIDPNQTYQQIKWFLATNDMMVLYSQGFLNVKNSEDQIFGIERLLEHCAEPNNLGAYDMVFKILNDIKAHKGKRPFRQDVSLICLKQLMIRF